MKQTTAALCCVPYRVTEQDGQVIFENESGFYGLTTRFAFEFSGNLWHLVYTEDTFGKVTACHLKAAIEFLDKLYDITYNDGKPSLTWAVAS